MNPFAKKAAAKAVSESEVVNAVHVAVANNAEADKVIDSIPSVDVIPAEEVEERLEGKAKLSKLIDDDFPFDESQLDAIQGISEEPYACLTGAAGTGTGSAPFRSVSVIASFRRPGTALRRPFRTL